MPNVLRYAGFKKEESYGVRGTGEPAFHVDIASASLDTPSDVHMVYSGGLGKSARTFRPGFYSPAGNVVYAFDIDTIANVLKWTLNGYNFKAGEAGGLNTHKIWANNSVTLDSLAVDLGKDVFEHQFQGCVIGSLEINVENEFCQATIDIKAKKDAKQTIKSACDLTLPTGYPLAFHEVNATQMGVGSSGADVAISADVRSLTLSIDNGLKVESGRSIGSRYPSRIPAYERQVTFNTKMMFNNTDELERFWGGASGPTDSGMEDFPLQFTFDSGDHGEMTILLPKVIYNGVKLQPSGRDEIVQEITGRAFIGEAPAPVDCEETEIYCVVQNASGTLA